VSRTRKDAGVADNSRVMAVAFLLMGSVAAYATSPATAQEVSREQDIGTLRLGQRVKVDDGTCPAGQIKEISGTKMTTAGVARSAKCVPRLGAKTSPTK
jgi:hypothetical protein